MIRTIEIKQSILKKNEELADEFRAELRSRGTFFVDVLASPGAGKTTLLLSLMRQIALDHLDCAVIEADLESDVDAQKIKTAGVPAVELNTNGICHVEMGMVRAAYEAFQGRPMDILFLENIGNLVCPADFDTGAHTRVLLLSVPEGWDKVCKYPQIFSVADALVVTKNDYLPLNPDFDFEQLSRRTRAINPNIAIFSTSARTGSGIEELADWLLERRRSELS